MKPCPVDGCGALILEIHLVCHPHWACLPQWAREGLSRLHRTKRGSELERATIAVALAYLNDEKTAPASATVAAL